MTTTRPGPAPATPQPCPDCPRLEELTSRRNKAIVAAAYLFVAVALAYSVAWISITGSSLARHRAYVVGRDARWEPFMQSIQDHLTRQDRDYAAIKAHVDAHEAQSRAILDNQAKILDALAGRRPR